jgi:hypothetical protein
LSRAVKYGVYSPYGRKSRMKVKERAGLGWASTRLTAASRAPLTAAIRPIMAGLLVAVARKYHACRRVT